MSFIYMVMLKGVMELIHKKIQSTYAIRYSTFKRL
jgi:hypothetical protein